MSDVKLMADVFGTSLASDPAQRLSNAIVLYGPEKDAAIHAIASYDPMVERIRVLEEAIRKVQVRLTTY